MTIITEKLFQNENAAHSYRSVALERRAACPHCGSENVPRMGGTRACMFLCNDCRDKFTVRTGSVMERSHVPLHKWLLGCI